MRLRAEELPRHLGRPLAPIYLLSGDEPLLVEEARDALRKAAMAQGFTERVSLHVETGFDWNALYQYAGGLSLFAERRMIDLRLPSGRPGDEGGRALVDYAARPSADNLLLITTGQVDGQTQKTKWFKALDDAGVVVQFWPPGAAQLPGWIGQRMRSRGLEPSGEALTLLAERVEGNLLACANEVEKILLLRGPGPVDAENVLEAVADSARFDVFDLVDAALAGDGARTLRILRGLEGGGIEPPLVLWALARAIRFHARASAGVARGQRLEQWLQGDRTWARRQALVEHALRRHSPAVWGRLLRGAARVDRVIKGQAAGNAWDDLLQLALSIGGVRIAAPLPQES